MKLTDQARGTGLTTLTVGDEVKGDDVQNESGGVFGK
jgi:hypothetical protein